MVRVHQQIARTFCFSNRGHGLYLCSPTEVQKFTVSAEFVQSLSEMVGELFLPHDMPEAPKESFFKGLFGGGLRSLDREELCEYLILPLGVRFLGDIFKVPATNPSHQTHLFQLESQSGRASRSVAKHIPGPQAAIQDLDKRVTGVTSEVGRAHQMMVERGEKLGKLEDRAEKMASEAENFSHTSHSLMLKYKDKKWYQL
uniref:V-SNARE coiled-coil homology domain-containing protein n=1 Tax=Timema douglasi TaxID=61478 RepID=A0A7R8VG17_TIMDO|nr:unnamed protein product [Timema douglasi]